MTDTKASNFHSNLQNLPEKYENIKSIYSVK